MYDSKRIARYMASIGLDTTDIIRAYFYAFNESENIEYFAIANELIKICLEEERNIEQYLKSR